MKNVISKLLLVTAIVVPTHVFAETYVDHSASADQTRVIHYTQERPAYNTTYRTTTTNMAPFYDREGYVSESNTTVVQAMQQALRDAGFYKLGDVNGVWTQHTSDALYSYQLANGLRGTARLDYPTGQRLGMAMPAMDKVMEGSTRAPEPNATTRHARSINGRRVIQDPTVVVEQEVHTGRPMHDDRMTDRMVRDPNRVAYHNQYRQLDSSEIQDIQQTLADAGFYKGTVDGLWGTQTRRALTSYQAANGLKATGKLNGPTLDKLGLVESDMDKDANQVAPAAGR